MSLARRQRRELAKQFGFLGRNETLDAMRERLQRSQKMGKQMHVQHLERVQNHLIQSRREREMERQEELAKGLNSENADTETKLTLDPSSFDFLKNTQDSEPSASAE